ncbi:MAG: DMT family transporter [Anaerolineae bacterium]|nr:DMT family transporter [Anaerolineae bacterium]
MSLHLSLHAPSVVQRVALRAIFYMALSSLCFSLVELVGQHMVSNVSPYQLVWARYFVHLLFMVLVLGPRYKTNLVRTSNLKLQIVRSLTMLAMPVCFIMSARYLALNNIWAIYWTSPLMALALSTWVLGEAAGFTRWVAGFIGLAGTLLIVEPDMGIFAPAALLALGMGLSISLHLMFSRILRKDHPLASLFYTALWVFLALSFVVPFLWSAPSLTSLVGMILVGIVGMVGLFALARSGELAPLSIVASFAYLEVVWTLILNLLLFGYVPDKRMIVGAFVIIAATAYLLIFEGNSSNSLAFDET